MVIFRRSPEFGPPILAVTIYSTFTTDSQVFAVAAIEDTGRVALHFDAARTVGDERISRFVLDAQQYGTFGQFEDHIRMKE